MIPNFYKYRLRLHGDIINEERKSIFIDRFNELSENDKCDLIFRGDRRSKILQAYKLRMNDVPNPFTHKLFLIGPKGRNFLDDLAKEIKKKKKFEVSDISNRFFGSIFEMLFHLLSGYSYHRKVKSVVEQFKKREKHIVEYFSNKKNKKEFLKNIKGLTEKEMVMLRDYYLTLLHHIADSEYYPISFMLSATTDFKVAKQFSKPAKKENDEIILFGWIPKSRDTVQSPFSYLGASRKISELGFPTFKVPFFPHQKEITLKGGLLPHFLLGFLYSENDVEYFEINPCLFDELDEKWIIDGLPVNQDGFWEELRATNMSGGFYVDDTGTYNGVRIKS